MYAGNTNCQIEYKSKQLIWKRPHFVSEKSKKSVESGKLRKKMINFALRNGIRPAVSVHHLFANRYEPNNIRDMNQANQQESNIRNQRELSVPTGSRQQSMGLRELSLDELSHITGG